MPLEAGRHAPKGSFQQRVSNCNPQRREDTDSASGGIYRCLVGREGGLGQKLESVLVLEDVVLPRFCPVAQGSLQLLKVGSKEFAPSMWCPPTGQGATGTD